MHPTAPETTANALVGIKVNIYCNNLGTSKCGREISSEGEKKKKVTMKCCEIVVTNSSENKRPMCGLHEYQGSQMNHYKILRDEFRYKFYQQTWNLHLIQHHARRLLLLLLQPRASLIPHPRGKVVVFKHVCVRFRIGRKSLDPFPFSLMLPMIIFIIIVFAADMIQRSLSSHPLISVYTFSSRIPFPAAAMMHYNCNYIFK